MARVFLIHADADAAAAVKFGNAIARNGLHVAKSDLPACERTQEDIEAILSRVDIVISLCSANWATCARCQREFATARERGASVLAVLLDGFKDETGVLEGLRTLEFESNAGSGAKCDILGTGKSRGNWPADKVPYPGLATYTAEWSPVFFGRDREIKRIVDYIGSIWRDQRSALVALTGPAGSGLSSLMQAGVLPELDGEDVVQFVLRPGAAPLYNLARTLSRAVGREAEAERWVEVLGGASQAALTVFLEKFALELAKTRSRESVKIVIAIDQICDLLYAAQPVEVEAFERVVAAARGLGGGIIFLLPLRFEELELLHRRKLAWSGIEPIEVEPVDDRAIDEIIRRPLEVAGYEIDNSLVAALIMDSRDFDRSEVPARLSFVLRKLCASVANDKVLRVSHYLGHAHQSASENPLEAMIASQTEAAYDRAGPGAAQSAAWRQALTEQLISFDQSNRPVRRLALRRHLPKEAQGLVTEMLAAGFLSQHVCGPEALVEVASDVLFKAWPRLRACVESTVREPLLIVSNAERPDAQEPVRGPDPKPVQATPSPAKRDTFRRGLIEAAAACVVFAAGVGLGQALFSPARPLNAHGPMAQQKVAQQPMGGVPLLVGAEWPYHPARLLAVADADGAIFKRAQRFKNRIEIIRERRGRALAEATTRLAIAQLGEARVALSGTRSEIETLQNKQGALEDQLKSERARAEGFAAKVADLSDQLARDTPTQAALVKSEAASQSAAEREDQAQRLKAAETAAAEASEAKASEHAAREASERTVQDLERRLSEAQTSSAAETGKLREDLANERKLRETSERTVSDLLSFKSKAEEALLQVERLRQDLAVERTLRETTEKQIADARDRDRFKVAARSDDETPRDGSAPDFGKAAEKAAVLQEDADTAEQGKDTSGEVENDREAARNSSAAHMGRHRELGARKFGSHEKASLGLDRKRRMSARNTLVETLREAQISGQQSSSGWKAIFPLKTRSRSHSTAILAASIYARSPRN